MQQIKKEIIDLYGSSQLNSILLIDLSTGSIDYQFNDPDTILVKQSIEEKLKELFSKSSQINKNILIQEYNKKLIKIIDDENKVFWFYMYLVDSIEFETHLFFRVENITGFMYDYVERVEMLDEKVKIIEEYYDKTKENLQRELQISSLKLQEKQQKFHDIYNYVKSLTNISSDAKKDILRYVRSNSIVQKYDLQLSSIGLNNSSYIKKISSLFPELSTKETELCNLIKMGMSNQEIASFLKKSLRTIENHRFRIRKKIKLDRSESLRQFLSNI